MKIDFKKMSFLSKRSNILGFKIHREGVQMDEEKVKRIQDFIGFYKTNQFKKIKECFRVNTLFS